MHVNAGHHVHQLAGRGAQDDIPLSKFTLLTIMVLALLIAAIAKYSR